VDRLFQKERVAVCLLDEALDRRAGQAALLQLRDQFGHERRALVGAQDVEGDHGPADLLDEELRLCVAELGSRGGEHEHRPFEVAQRLDELDESRFRPVQVLEQEQQWPARRKQLEGRMPQCSSACEMSVVVNRAARRRRRAQQVRQRRSDRAQLVESSIGRLSRQDVELGRGDVDGIAEGECRRRPHDLHDRPGTRVPLAVREASTDSTSAPSMRA
jgi:hypothetical protein